MMNDEPVRPPHLIPTRAMRGLYGLPMERPQSAVYTATAVANAFSNVGPWELGFLARSVIIDNPTGQWWYLPSLSLHVPPNVMGVVLPMVDGTQEGYVIPDTPVGQTTSVTTGQLATFIFTALQLPMSPGTPTAGTAVTFAAPTITLSTVAAAGVASTAIRSDATIIAFDVTVPVTQAFGDAAATGAATVAARRDHKHGMPAFAAPTIALGTAAAAGAATTPIRSDATILAFDATAPVTQAFGDAAATGAATVAARRDHKHGMPAFAAPTIALGTAAAAGAAATPIRSDATILAFDAVAPVTQAFSDAAAVGVATVAARRDHKHGMPASPSASITFFNDLISGDTVLTTALTTAITRTPAAGTWLIIGYAKILAAAFNDTMQGQLDLAGTVFAAETYSITTTTGSTCFIVIGTTVVSGAQVVTWSVRDATTSGSTLKQLDNGGNASGCIFMKLA